MAINYVKLAAELAAGHPVTGAYNVDDALAAAELNAKNIDNDAPVSAMYDYLLNKNHRTNQGTDTQFTPILGRLEHVARSAVGDDPFGRGAGNELILIQVHAAMAFSSLFNTSHVSGVAFQAGSGLPLGTLNGAGIISPAHQAAIEALSENQINVLQDNPGIGLIQADAGHVARARA